MLGVQNVIRTCDSERHIALISRYNCLRCSTGVSIHAIVDLCGCGGLKVSRQTYIKASNLALGE